MQRSHLSIGMTNPIRILTALIAALLFLAACSDDGGGIDQSPGSVTTPTTIDAIGTESTPKPTSTTTDGEQPEPTATPDVQQLGMILPAGRYCYAGDDGITTLYLRMTVLDSGEVSGDTRIGIADEEAAYFTSASQRFDGYFDEDAMIVASLTTWVEYDIQESVESWSVLPSSLETRLGTIQESPCDVVREKFVDVTIPSTGIGVTADELIDRAFQVDERAALDADATSATVGNSLTKGEADRYVFEASGGEFMTVLISSLEDNAVFDVVSDSGFVLAIEATSAVINLPNAGDFFVIVSSTRADATYEVSVAIA